jgi:putative glutamine amidotransferase
MKLPEKSPPLIGLSSSFHNSFEARIFFHEEVSYIRSIRGAGGVPVFLTTGLTERDLADQLGKIAGLLLLGGDDVDPTLYGQKKQDRTRGVNTKRDSLELALTRHAIQTKKPLLAICRGIQLVNVALGGTLFQHIITDMPGACQHDHHKDGQHRLKPRDFPAHLVDLVPGTLISRIIGKKTVATNSLHHQGLDKVPEQLLISGRCAEDGLVEAVELQHHPFFLGVQWHPEEMTSCLEMQRIFAAFVSACKGEGVDR